MTSPIYGEINRGAVHIEDAARVIRREAGGLRYHPVTGLARRPGAEFDAAVRALAESMARVLGWAEELTGEGAEVRRQAEQLRVALDLLRQALARPERAPLDAPYGLGTPRRPHPGAQATWVAERAEHLARTLARLAVLGENGPFAGPAPERAPSATDP